MATSNQARRGDARAAPALIIGVAVCLSVAGAAISGGALGQPPAEEPSADLVVLDGRVITVDPAFRIVEAVAIRDGRFVAVGTTSDVRPLIGSTTRVIEARGRSVVPGLIDSHVHALSVAAAEMEQPFRNLTSVSEIQDWIRERALETTPGTWIWSPRVFPTRISERRFPTRAELDTAATDHPVVVDGAYALKVNSAALRAASIAADTPGPPGGAIVKDASGEPTGLLRNARGLVSAYRRSAEREGPSLDALEQVHRAYSRVGITSVMERGASLDGYRVYEALARSGRLGVRATVTLRIPDASDRAAVDAFIRSLPFEPRAGDEWLAVGPLKIGADGGILAGTSFMREPYGVAAAELFGVDDPTYRGFLSLTPDQIAAAFDAGHARGWQMAAHVTGDAGVDVVLDAIEAAQARRPSTDRRHTLIHAYFPGTVAAERAARLGVVVDTQPAWYFKDADALADALGRDRLERFIGLDTWLAAGVPTAINTDHMFGLDPDSAMNPFNPFLTMAVAVTRRTEQGTVIGRAERITREQALRLMTIDAARLSFDETEKGSIEVGKLGDLAILSDDFLLCPEDRLRSMTVDLTIVGGRVTYER